MTHALDGKIELPDESELSPERLLGTWQHMPSETKASRESLCLAVKTLYQKIGLREPSIVVCDSIFQLTVYPVLIALMLDETGRETIPVLRDGLKDAAWARLWENLDQQLAGETLADATQFASKAEQERSLKELNRHIHYIYQELGGTVDTHETPRLTSVGLQVNSNFRAEMKLLLTKLDREANGKGFHDLREKEENTLSEISTTWQTVEAQLDLQLMPGVLAQSVAAMKTVLAEHNIRHANRLDSEPFGLSNTLNGPNSLSEVLRLICQASDAAHDFRFVRNLRGTGGGIQESINWNTERIGSYRDPAVRLIASSLQLELFKKAPFLSNLPVHSVINKTFFESVYNAQNASSLELWCHLLRNSYALIFYQDLALVCELPTYATLDSEHRFHNEIGPALRFSDDFSVYVWHGRRVTDEIIERPSSITIDRIENEPNVEIRSILVERYGISKFLKDSGAKKIHEDEYGILYRKRFESSDPFLDEPLVVVRVHNATPEPDGFHKQFFLRVPPNITTAKEAVAWTFGLDSDDYAPQIET